MENLPTSDEVLRPGAYIESAIDAVPDIVNKTVDRMTWNPHPISDEQLRVSHRLASLATLDFPDTADTEENMAHFIQGMEWGYAMAQCSAIDQPRMDLTLYGNDAGPEVAFTHLRQNITDFVYTNTTMHWDLIRAVMEKIDPNNTYRNCTGWGVISALFMVDQAERNKRLKQQEEFRQERARLVQADFDMAFNILVDETVTEEKAAETQEWYKLQEQLEGEGLWENGY